MRRKRRSGPVVQNRDGSWSIELDENEREVLLVSVTQLRGLLESGESDGRARRLFPTAYNADEEADQEWQRLMREELVKSRVAAIDNIESRLRDESSFGETELTSLMITVNALRLVLGTLLGITDDEADDMDDLDPDDPGSAQWHLYMWLGWLLEWMVTAQDPESGDSQPGD